MPNWASVSYRIEGEDKSIEKIYTEATRILNESHTSQNTWVGDLLKALGIGNDTMKGMSLRAFISSVSMEGETIALETEEAWGMSDFKMALESLYPDLVVYYQCEEPGCEVFVTNDGGGKYFRDRWIVDSNIDDNYDTEYFNADDKKEMDSYIANLIGNGKDDYTEDELDEWSVKNPTDSINIHEFEIADD